MCAYDCHENDCCAADDGHLETVQVARAIAAHEAFFTGCILTHFGNCDGFEDLAQQMYLLEHALAKAAAAPRRLPKVATRGRSYKKRFSLLREDFGSLLAVQTIQVLAEEPISVVAALVALREAATALLLVHEALFYSCSY